MTYPLHPTSQPCCWKNLIFDRFGRSRLGLKTYSSEQAAREAAEDEDWILAELKRRGQKWYIETMTENVPWDDYAYTVPVPWLGQ